MTAPDVPPAAAAVAPPDPLPPSAVAAPTGPTAAPELALVGSIPPRPLPLGYRLGLALTTVAVVLLPLVYVGLIGAAGWAMWWYATEGGAQVLENARGLWALLAYLGPLVIGGLLIVFMVKPIFARPARQADPLTVDLALEPVLRDLIAGIARHVGAPMPVRLDFDCQVNASARLRRGLLSLGRRDLVLTIGLPLAGGLSARELAGVIAHELGHFAQGAGMASTYVIRSINGWFARVVFERDAWDEALARGAGSVDLRLGIVLYVAQAMIWLSRKLLHGLMLLAHAITCYQLRQMEYDADYYETHVAGSAAFATTSHALLRLGAAGQIAFQDLGRLWHEQRLVDDFPRFVLDRHATLPADQLARIERAHTEQPTRWLDTHPSHRDRVAHASALAQPGLFQGDLAAAELFEDFDGLSRAVTLHFYSAQLELQVQPGQLVAARSAAQASARESSAETTLQAVTGGVLDPRRPVLWAASDFTPTSDDTTVALATTLGAARAALDALRPAAQSAAQIFNTLDNSHRDAELGLAFIAAGVEVKPEAFGLLSARPEAARKALDQLTARRDAKAAELQPFEGALQRWVAAAVRATHLPALAAPLDEAAVSRVRATAEAVVMLAPLLRTFSPWVRQHQEVMAFGANATNLSTNPTFRLAHETARSRSRDRLREALALAAAVPNPLGNGDSAPATLLAQVEAALAGVEGEPRFGVLLEHTVGFYFRLLAHLVHASHQITLGAATAFPEAVAPAAVPPRLTTA